MTLSPRPACFASSFRGCRTARPIFCIARTTGRTARIRRHGRLAAPHRPTRRRSRLRRPPCRGTRLCRRPQPCRPADHHADRRVVPNLPAHRLRRTGDAVAPPEAPHRRERARVVDLRADVRRAACRFKRGCFSPTDVSSRPIAPGSSTAASASASAISSTAAAAPLSPTATMLVAGRDVHRSSRTGVWNSRWTPWMTSGRGSPAVWITPFNRSKDSP